MTIVAGLRKQRDDNYGTSSLSELASALGAPQYKGVLSSGDLSDINTTSIYVYSNQEHVATDAPKALGYVITYILSNNLSMQYFVSANHEMFFRRKWFASYGNWNRNYDESILTDSTILSPLASALGAIGIEYQVINHDFNTLGTSIVQNAIDSDNTQNLHAPEGKNAHFLIFTVGNKVTEGFRFAFQFAVEFGIYNVLYMRICWGSNWNPWNKITFAT